MSRRSAVPCGLAVFAFCATLLPATPASARLVESATIHEEYSFTAEDFCGEEGLDVLIMGTHDFKYTAVSQGHDGLVHFRARDVFDETHTANGVTTRVLVNSPSRDLKVTDNGDGTLTITVLATGNATLYGPNGNAIARNPGQLRFRFDVDDGGTPTDPSDDQEIEGTFEVIKGSTGRSDDFCAAELALFT
jgi:hypothetical protein